MVGPMEAMAITTAMGMGMISWDHQRERRVTYIFQLDY
jgi:hypothetical protein